MKRKLAISTMLVALGLTDALVDAAQQQQDPYNSTGLPAVLWKRGLAIAPVPLNMTGRNKKQVGMGSYIVNATARADCHTNLLYMTGGDPFKGQSPQINAAAYLGGRPRAVMYGWMTLIFLVAQRKSV